MRSGQPPTVEDTAAAGKAEPVGVSSTGMPFSTALPDNGSTANSSESTLELTPALAADTSIFAPGMPWPQPCGSDTTPDITLSVTWTGTTTSPDPERTSACAPSARP